MCPFQTSSRVTVGLCWAAKPPCLHLMLPITCYPSPTILETIFAELFHPTYVIYPWFRMSSLLFGNGTDIMHWKPSPNTRGTFDILSTCVITMLLCVWTAVHLNIPPPGSVWKPRLRKFGWLILALLAPEMVAYTAW